MHLNLGIICAAVLATLAPVTYAADSAVYRDPETGFLFSSFNAAFTLGNYITFRVAIPSNVSQNQPYDAVVQISGPLNTGWAGLAWGGTMIRSPLSPAWQNGNSAPVIGLRWATQHAAPSVYNGASYQVFRTGTNTNGTRWQVTAKCTGCTTYQNSASQNLYINPQGTNNRLAFAYSNTRPSQPSSNASPLTVHDVYNYWNHDFAAAQNPDFTALVQKNL